MDMTILLIFYTTGNFLLLSLQFAFLLGPKITLLNAQVFFKFHYDKSFHVCPESVGDWWCDFANNIGSFILINIFPFSNLLLHLKYPSSCLYTHKDPLDLLKVISDITFSCMLFIHLFFATVNSFGFKCPFLFYRTLLELFTNLKQVGVTFSGFSNEL